MLSLASLADSRWINLAELEDLTLEKVSENDLKEKHNLAHEPQFLCLSMILLI